MLKFAVYENGSEARDWPLYHAHLLGADNIGVESEITFADGCICCDKKSVESAALVLLADVREHGSLVLPTCLLPDRDEPYLLHLELARHRIKTFITKLEDWLLCGIEPDHPVMKLWDEARRIFTKALVIQERDPARADEYAKDALIKGMSATEQLALMHADLLIAKRANNGEAPALPIGCYVHQSRYAEPIARIMSQNFNFLSIPIRWREVEPEEGVYDWKQFDRWMQWASRSKYPVIAGPIIDLRPLAVPEWLYVWEHDYDTTHDLFREHIEAIVKRYRNVVSIWNIASALHINENFTLAYDELIEVTRMAILRVKALHPAARTMIEITDPFGEYYATNSKSIPPIVYADTLAQSASRPDLIGINFQFGHHKQGRGTRDLMQVSSVLDELIHADIPVIVSGLGCPSHRAKIDGIDPAGYWREPWTATQQSDYLEHLTGVCLSKPFVESVCIHELYDHTACALPGAGLITATGRAKPALAAIGRMQKDIKSGSFRCSSPEERVWSEDDLPDDADLIE